MHLYWVYLKLIARVYYSFYIFIREKASMYSQVFLFNRCEVGAVS